MPQDIRPRGRPKGTWYRDARARHRALQRPRASSVIGPLSLTGTLTLVDSRVARLANGYLGDLRVGDRMLEVPARTVDVQARWTATRWELRGSVARAADWVNYDEVALAKAVAADPGGQLLPVGEALRAYWMTYHGVTHADAAGSAALRDHPWLACGTCSDRTAARRTAELQRANCSL